MSRRFLIIGGIADSLISFRGSLIEAIARNGWEVHAAAPKLSSDARSCAALRRAGIVVHDIPLRRTGTNPAADLWLVWCLFRLMRKVQPDAVLGYTIKPVIFGTISAWLARVPHRFALITGLGFVFTGRRKGMLGWLVRSMYGFAIARVEVVFFQNSDDLLLFGQERVLAADTHAVVVNGSGVDLAVFQETPVSHGPPRFLMMCRLLGDKGVREYVQAARTVKAINPEVYFALAGWVDENPDSVTQDELEGWVSEGAIDFLGRLSDVRPVIAASSVFVLPSYREGTPHATLEAMATGRAVITTDAPGCRETVVDGRNGFLVAPRSANELVRAMRRFVENPMLAVSMGQASRRLAELKYDVREVNAVMIREMGLFGSVGAG